MAIRTCEPKKNFAMLTNGRVVTVKKLNLAIITFYNVYKQELGMTMTTVEMLIISNQ